MPRFYFHTTDVGRIRDKVGDDFCDLTAARKEAVKYAGAIVASDPDALRDGRDFRVEVTDDREMLLFTVVILAIDAPASGKPPWV